MQCSYCERRCDIPEGGTGFCRMYTSLQGVITERFPGRWSACGTSVIESMPFYHIYPGSRCLTIGTAGCNFRCRYCSNAYIAKEDPEVQADKMYRLSAADLVGTAMRFKCKSIVFNVNEPAVSIPSMLEVANEARRAGIMTGCLTNAYMTEESTELLVSMFTFFNISLKGLSDEFNRRYIGIPSCGPVLRNIAAIAAVRHVEITTPLIQDCNDAEIDAMADFIADISPSIPWHVFRLLPGDEMHDAAYPDIDRIDGELISAREKLRYVYFHNFVGSDWVNTLCPSCGAVVIERFSLGCGGDKLNRNHCDGNSCPECGRAIDLVL